MIKVSNLTKRFVGRTAVDAISFNVEPGEIVGFLGPNGAGKTTTIRILTGYMPATSGSATVAGHDIFKDSLKAQQRISYMPENVPLYDDMRVKEYLRFRALLNGMRGLEAKNGIAEAIDLCGLTDMRGKMIGTLSKGYRQRVGLADALIHNPELLILDEPTNGLDPNQIRRVRKLIKQLGLSHTILISTHILSEVEMTCDRVIILDRGKIRAADTPKNLIRRLRTAGHISVEINAAAGAAADAIKKIPRVKKVIKESTEKEWTKFTVRAESGTDVREDIVNLANTKNWALREIHSHGASLEDVFVELTQSTQTD